MFDLGFGDTEYSQRIMKMEHIVKKKKTNISFLSQVLFQVPSLSALGT